MDKMKSAESALTPRSSSSSNNNNNSNNSSSSSSTHPQQQQQQQQQQQKQQDVWGVLSHAKSQAFKGGVAGASAQVINVLTFMWLRTTMNYQYRHGGSTAHVIKTLWKEGKP